MLAPLGRAGSVKAIGKFSMYYIAEVEPKKSGGIAGKVQTVDGKWETYRLSRADTKAANMEGTVVIKGPNGKNSLASIIKVGRWVDLPEGWQGKGNRMNPLTPYRTVAADEGPSPSGTCPRPQPPSKRGKNILCHPRQKNHRKTPRKNESRRWMKKQV